MGQLLGMGASAVGGGGSSGGGGASGSSSQPGSDYTWGLDTPTQAPGNILTNPLTLAPATMDPGGGMFSGGGTPAVDPGTGQPPAQQQSSGGGGGGGGGGGDGSSGGQSIASDINNFISQLVGKPSGTGPLPPQGPSWFTQTPTSTPSAAGGYGGGQVTQGTTAPAPDQISPTGQPSTVGGGYGGGSPTEQQQKPAQAPVGNAPVKPPAATLTRAPATKPGGTPPPVPPAQAVNPLQAIGDLLLGGPQKFAQDYRNQNVNPLQAIADLLFGGPQKFAQDLQGLNQQAGPAYGTTPPRTPVDQHPPPGNDAAAAVRQGFDRAQQNEQQTGEKPPLVLRDPSDPSKGYMPDPNFAKPPGTGANAAAAAAQGQSADGVPGEILHQAQRLAGMGPGAIFKFMSDNGHPRDGAWCGEFAASIMHSQGLPVPEHPETASNWRNWGNKTNQPQPGDIAVRNTSYINGRYVPTGAQGAHVTSVEKVYADGSMDVIGGNQGYDRNGRLLTRVHVPPGDARNYDFRTMRGARTAAQNFGPDTPRPPENVPFVDRTIELESGGRQGVRSGSNRGIGQFGPTEEHKYGITNRNDPNQEKRAIQQEAQENSAILKNAGVEPTPASLYLMHQQGQSGGRALLTASQDTPAWQAVRRYYRSDAEAQRVISGNIPGDNPLHHVPVQNVTAGQFRDMWRDHYNGQTSSPAPTPTTRTPAMGPVAQGNQPIRMPIQLAGDINPDVARLVEQRNRELESDRRRNAILGRRPTLEEGSPRKEHVPNRRFHPSDIDEFIQRNAGSLINAIPLGRAGSAIKNALQPTTVGRDEDVR